MNEENNLFLNFFKENEEKGRFRAKRRRFIRKFRDKRNQRNLDKSNQRRHKLKSFQISQLVYDVTVRFCNRYIEKRSRTHDQMVQAARSGVQNIAEGSQASGTSKKTELKLTSVARASIEELRLDYEDYLRQRGLLLWEKDEPLRQ